MPDGQFANLEHRLDKPAATGWHAGLEHRYGLDTAQNGYQLADLFCKPSHEAPLSRGLYSGHGMAFVLRGTFDYQTAGVVNTAVPGSVLFANKGDVFECRHLNAQGNRRVVLFFADGFIEGIAEDLGRDNVTFARGGHAPAKETAHLGGLLFKALKDSELTEDAAIAGAYFALGHHPFNDHHVGATPYERRRILEAVEHVSANYAEACSLDDLAAVAGLGRFRFARLFKTVTGETPCQYVVNTRLCAAANKLHRTNAPVTTIAFDVGFNDLSYFNARFKATFGCTPRAWRKH